MARKGKPETRVARVAQWGERAARSIARGLQVGDPLDDAARRSRRALLVAAAAGFVVESTRLVPTEFTMLGVRMEGIRPRDVAFLAALALAYFVVSYILDVGTSLVLWWDRVRAELAKQLTPSAMEEVYGPPISPSAAEDEREYEVAAIVHGEIRQRAPIRFESVWIPVLRDGFRVIAPLAFGIYMLARLWRAD